MTKMNNVCAFDLKSMPVRIDNYLQQVLMNVDAPPRLHDAMCYVVLGGGKRLRPLLVYAAGASLTDDLTTLDPAAAAVELIHCYSLVHDDLPAMDDDDLRRGKPTCHKAFDEATAILVGDALETLAFGLLTDHQANWSSDICVFTIKTLAQAAGAAGMVGGQLLDIESEGQSISVDELEKIHRLKTGALIRASVRLGVLATGCQDDSLLEQLDKFSALIGLAFQVQDDLLDVESNTEILGKRAGADVALHKATYPGLLGLSETKKYLKMLYDDALTVLNQLPIDTTYLHQVWQLLCDRRS